MSLTASGEGVSSSLLLPDGCVDGCAGPGSPSGRSPLLRISEDHPAQGMLDWIGKSGSVPSPTRRLNSFGQSGLLSPSSSAVSSGYLSRCQQQPPQQMRRPLLFADWCANGDGVAPAITKASVEAFAVALKAPLPHEEKDVTEQPDLVVLPQLVYLSPALSACDGFSMLGARVPPEVVTPDMPDLAMLCDCGAKWLFFDERGVAERTHRESYEATLAKRLDQAIATGSNILLMVGESPDAPRGNGIVPARIARQLATLSAAVTSHCDAGDGGELWSRLAIAYSPGGVVPEGFDPVCSPTEANRMLRELRCSLSTCAGIVTANAVRFVLVTPPGARALSDYVSSAFVDGLVLEGAEALDGDVVANTRLALWSGLEKRRAAGGGMVNGPKARSPVKTC